MWRLAYADKAEQEASKEAKVFNCMQRKARSRYALFFVPHLTLLQARIRTPLRISL